MRNERLRGSSLLLVRTTRMIMAAVASAALIVAACGTSDDTSSPDPTAFPVTGTATAAVDQPAAATPNAVPTPGTVAPATPSATATASPTPQQPIATPTSAPATTTAIPTAEPTERATTPTAAPPTPVPATPTAAASPSTGSSVLDVLNSLSVAPEYGGSGYERPDFEHDRGYLCDASGTDPYTGVAFDASTCDVDHIVAAQEAFESGAWEWNVSRRRAFGNDALNLVATRDCVNRSKGARDMAEWSGRVGSGVCEGTETTVDGRCFMAQKMVQVKAAYSLSVDLDEKAALTTALDNCSGRSLPTTEGLASGTIEADSDCHPAYSPCLPNLPGDALNCGDLTAAQKPVTVLVPGVDPYRLDRDGDGRGCTS